MRTYARRRAGPERPVDKAYAAGVTTPQVSADRCVNGRRMLGYGVGEHRQMLAGRPDTHVQPPLNVGEDLPSAPSA